MNLGTVRTRLILGLAALILLIVGFCGFTYLQLTRMETQAVTLSVDSIPGLSLAGQIEAASIAAHSAFEQHVLDRDTARMQELAAELQRETEKLHSLLTAYESTIVSARDRELHQAIKVAEGPYNVSRNRALRLSMNPKSKEEAQSESLVQVEPAYARLRESIQAQVAFNRTNADEAGRQIRGAIGGTRVAILIGLVGAFGLALITGFMLLHAVNRPLSQLVAAVQPISSGDLSHRVKLKGAQDFELLAEGFNGMTDSLQEMIRRIQKSGLQINTSVTEIAATSQEQLSTASEIAATTSEIGATSKEISATSKELAQTLKQIASAAERTAELAASGQSGLSRMKNTMQQVAEASGAIHTRLAVLSEKTGNISGVVTTITKVADQTNLLSLNAAIEAEKAGDYGRGFSVVATEIRRLADQTAGATGDIEQMVKEMQSAATAGVMGMDKFSDEVRRGVEVVQQVSEELSQIIVQVQALTPNFETVSEGMQCQSLGAQQISEALSQLTEASRQTVESLRQSNTAIEKLNDASRGLQDGVARFILHK